VKKERKKNHEQVAIFTNECIWSGCGGGGGGCGGGGGGGCSYGGGVSGGGGIGAGGRRINKKVESD
jgi:hypothetical protein